MPSRQLLSFLLLFPILATSGTAALAQRTDQGREFFELNCGRCHGGDARGGEYGPSIVPGIAGRTDADLAAYLLTGNPERGMPPMVLPEENLYLLVGYLRALAPFGRPPREIDQRTLSLTDGSTVSGIVLGEGYADLQLRSDDGDIYLLRKSDTDRYRHVSSETDWASYHGDTRGYRHTELTQITPANVGLLAPVWNFPMPVAGAVQNTPIVVDGIMLVSSANELWALDAGTGRQVWHWSRPRTEGLVGNATLGMNRGVALAGNRIFMLTDNAHMIALDKSNGSLLWETPMADWTENYNSTNAPLIVNDLVIGGHAGGDEGVRGFISAYRQDTGDEAWRFWTIPAWGEPGSETWPNAQAIAHGAGATWMTGSFDPELNIVYWQVGNPGPDLYGVNRAGDNLYTDSVLALDADTGELLWHYQFTPHDIHDWDAQEPLALIDTEWEGQLRKLLVQANRNGFFYVLDREDGELLLAEPFIEKLNWAEGIGEDGRPILKELPLIATGETYVCPALIGGTNWYSTGYIEATGLYYIQALESCNLFSNRYQDWQQGGSYMGGTARGVPGESATKSIRAIDIRTGEIAFDIPQGPAGFGSSAGLMTTATGLVIFGENSGAFMAADAVTGDVLWQYQGNQGWRASPMAYEFDGRQYIAVAIGRSITAFALPEAALER